MSDFSYRCIIHPSDIEDLTRPLSPKEKWYAGHHRKRWERRYGRPYPEVEFEIGIIRGIRFVGET